MLLEVPVPAGLEPIVKLEGLVLEGKPLAEGDVTDGLGQAPDRGAPGQGLLHLPAPGLLAAARRCASCCGPAWPGRYRIRPARLVLMSNEAQWTTCDGASLAVQEGGQP